MTFHKYLYYRIYRLFHLMKSRNAHNMTVGVITIFLFLITYKAHVLILKYIFNEAFIYKTFEIPYMIVVLTLFAINSYLYRNAKSQELFEALEKKTRQTTFDAFLIGIAALLVLVFTIW